jgi:hypothetical protein
MRDLLGRVGLFVLLDGVLEQLEVFFLALGVAGGIYLLKGAKVLLFVFVSLLLKVSYRPLSLLWGIFQCFPREDTAF